MAKMLGAPKGGHTKDTTTVPVSKKAKTSANVQKNAPGASKKASSR